MSGVWSGIEWTEGENKRFKRLERFKLNEHDLDYLHRQWQADITVQQLNALATDIDVLDCRGDKARNERAWLLAKHSPILAAKALDLKECYHLRSFGETAILSQCERKLVVFAVMEDSCGPQPFFRNLTIADDGKTLRPASICYWQGGTVNFEGRPYEAINDTWVPVEASFSAKLSRLDAHVNISVDRSSAFQPFARCGES